jgi:hypothetical protein
VVGQGFGKGFGDGQCQDAVMTAFAAIIAGATGLAHS